MEESEISWINQTDLSPLIAAFPSVEYLCIHGGMNPSFSAPLKHAKLKELTIQSGGLPSNAVQSVAAAELPPSSCHP